MTPLWLRFVILAPLACLVVIGFALVDTLPHIACIAAFGTIPLAILATHDIRVVDEFDGQEETK